MKENYFYRQTKAVLDDKAKVDKATDPVLKVEQKEGRVAPTMSFVDHFLSLRKTIQDKVEFEPEPPTDEDKENIKLLSELISPELMAEYNVIFQNIKTKTTKSKDHLQREYIDLEEENLNTQIEHWVVSLLSELGKNSRVKFEASDLQEVEAQAYIFFDAIVSVLNTQSIERDITEFSAEKKLANLQSSEHKKEREEILNELGKRYPLSRVELECLVDIVSTEKKGDQYSFGILVKEINCLWREYDLGAKKKELSRISGGYLMSSALTSFSPSLFKNLIVNNQFNVAVFFETFMLNKGAEVIEAKANIELDNLMYEVNQAINTRITNSLFFQEFEFIHERSLGEVYSALEKGKEATQELIAQTIAKFVPTLSGIIMSLGFLAKINPILGGVGFASLPVMYKVAKDQNEKIWPMYKKERIEGEKIATRIGAVKSGLEEIKTSAEAPTVAEHVREQLDIRDKLTLNRRVEEAKMRLLRAIPFDVSTAVAAGVGGAFQRMGLISGGAVLSNIIYTNQLNRPIQELVDLYFNTFSRNLQDIKRMEEILGKYEALDLPEGEKEADRIPVTELPNMSIDIKNLNYKGILRGIDLHIDQGEFVVISGTSGAGKSTLLRNLAGLYKPESGSIAVGGTELEHIQKYGLESIYSAMSYCNQNPQIFEGMTLRENLLLWSRQEVSEEQVQQVLRDLHLDKFADKLDQEVKNLSGGERVRLGVARTLIKGAKILLLDEPTASLDSQGATEVRKILREIHDKYPDTTIVCVSHDDELMKKSDREVNIGDLQKS
jgi:putative ABC transport system ATP-binding protein